jgi:hypothetical protein
MTKPMVSRRRIDQLKVIAYDQGLTNEDAKQFGKLSKTATWEALLESRDTLSQVADTTVNSDTESLDTRNWTNDASFPVCNFTPQDSINFFEWVDIGQLIALAIASAGIFVLFLNLWPRINPLKLLPPIKVNIQIGGSK